MAAELVGLQRVAEYLRKEGYVVVGECGTFWIFKDNCD